MTRRAKPARLLVQSKLRRLAPLQGKDDRLICVATMFERVGDRLEFRGELKEREHHD